MPANNQSQVPAIRGFQFGSGGNQNQQKSVNLFRGDINLNQKLISLPGRIGEHGLDVDISILYQSNIHAQATHWNLDAPTGILGVGWSLPLDKIVKNDNNSPSPITCNFTHEINGSQNIMILEEENPFLFSLLNANLQNGKAIGLSVQKKFGEVGVLIDAKAIPTQDDENWIITDNVNQQLFRLTQNGNNFEVYEGGESYQLQGFKFWRIIYYPIFEKWVITKESGIKYIYGGIKSTLSPKTSINNSIEWGVRWGIKKKGKEIGCWLGDSANTDNQQQYARAWHLNKVLNIWGDSIEYAYNETTVGPRSVKTGILASDVEQKVGGENGLPYTKACYLTHIQDVFGRQAVFIYGNKVYDNSSEEAPREYLYPHLDYDGHPDSGYQEHCETKFLDEIFVNDESGNILFSYKLEYRPDSAPVRNQNLANVSDNTSGGLKGVTYKRFLTGVTEKNAYGTQLPGLKFDYYFKPTDENPGGLKSVTYPEGRIVTYSYKKQKLDICNRQQTIVPPEDAKGKAAKPHITFGNDYVVSLWYTRGTQNLLTMEVYTWLGRWVCWRNEPDAVIFKNVRSYNSIKVIANQNFFGLYFETSEENKARLYIFEKDLGKPGLWRLGKMENNTETNPIILPLSQSKLSFIGGNSFLCILNRNVTKNTHSTDTFVYNWTNRMWASEKTTSIPTSNVHLVAGAEVLCKLIIREGPTGKIAKLTLSYLDNLGNWHQSDTQEVEVNPPSYESIALTIGYSCVGLSVKSGVGSTNLKVDFYLFQWGDDYKFLDNPYHKKFEDHYKEGSTLPSSTPQIIANTMVGVATRCFRASGLFGIEDKWLENSKFYDGDGINFNNNSIQSYAYAENYAIQSIYEGNKQNEYNFLEYRPSENIKSWENGLRKLESFKKVSDKELRKRLAHGSASANYFIAGNHCYSRFTFEGKNRWTTDWSNAVNNPMVIDKNISAESIINEAPNFICFLIQNTEYPYDYKGILPFILKNGQYVIQDEIKGQKYYTAAEAQRIGHQEPGAGPAGANAFVTYESKNFEDAQELFLYRFAGNSFNGLIEHSPVDTITTDDGYGQIFSTKYAFDTTKATCDLSGKVVKYYKSNVYPGCQDIVKKDFGYIVNKYLNGFDHYGDGTGYNASDEAKEMRYDMLDGMKIEEEMYNSKDELIASEKKTWKVFTRRNRDPKIKDEVLLHGGYVQLVQQEHMVDGITTVTNKGYVPPGLNVPYSGQLLWHNKIGNSGLGKEEIHTEYKTYAYEKDHYPAIRALNMLTTVVQTKECIKQHLNEELVFKASSATLKRWDSKQKTQVPAIENNFEYTGPGPFQELPNTSNGEIPAGWILHAKVLNRTDLGLVQETQDAEHEVHSILHDKYQQFKVAVFTHASLTKKECCFIGFEYYEDQTFWKISGETKIINNDGHTGASSLQVPAANKGTFEINLTPAISREPSTFLLGFWYKTGEKYTPKKDSGWKINVNGASEVKVPFQKTNGSWLYACQGIKLPDGNGSAALKLVVSNAADVPVLLDDIQLSPLVSVFSANVFDPVSKYAIAIHAKGGITNRLLRDDFSRIVMHTGPSTTQQNQVKSLNLSFLSRQGNEEDIFQPMDPNCNIALHPAEGGTPETFTQGDVWQQRWNASNYPAHWEVNKGTLQHRISDKDTLSLQTPMSGKSWALYFEVRKSGEISNPTGINFGSGNSISWNGNKWEGTLGGNPLTTLVTPNEMANHWLLIQSNKLLLFYGDGQLIFSQASLPNSNQSIHLFTGENQIGYRNLAYMEDPSLASLFQDTFGHSRQSQKLFEAGALVEQTIYDSMTRVIVQTKAAPANFGKGAGKPVMQYRPDFVQNVADFVNNRLIGTGEMQGDVADYYRGKEIDAYIPSNDEGYPYARKRFEDSPTGRLVEKGMPGKIHAIINPNTTSPESRPTVQIQYGKNEADTLPYKLGLPVGEYHLKTQTSPQQLEGSIIKRITTKHLSDKFGRPVATAQIGSDGILKIQTQFYSTYTEEGITVTKRLPNYFSSPPQNDARNFVFEQKYNFIHKILEEKGPNTGAILQMHDAMGQLRFKKPNQTELPKPEGCPASEETPYLLYFKYDPIGRLIESGFCDFDWNAATDAQLKKYAEDPNWPSKANQTPITFHPAKYLHYDGDGNDATQIGRITEVVSINDRPTLNKKVNVSENYQYYIDGEIKNIVTSVDSAPNLSAQVDYTYNNTKHIKSIHIKNATALDRIYYDYDELGNISKIGSKENTSDFAAYAYDTEEKLVEEKFNQGQIGSNYRYSSLGNLTQKQLSSQTPQQVQGHFDYTHYLGNNIQTIESQITDGTTENPYQVKIEYDGLNRFHSLNAASDEELNTTVNEYDGNFNIHAVTRNNKMTTIDYTSGMDLPKAVNPDEKDEKSVCYNNQGRITRAPQSVQTEKSNELSYDKVNQLTGSVKIQSNENTQDMALYYGYKNKRVLKEITENDRVATNKLYVHGTNAEPLVEFDSRKTDTVYIPGHNGILGFKNMDGLYFYIKDHQGSVRAVIDAAIGKIQAAYTYYPFGNVKATGKKPEITDYLFTGQELDRETGLFNYKARMYDPEMGRFYAPDPKRQYSSPYVYVGDNPIMGTDPSGELANFYGVVFGVFEAIGGGLLTYAGLGAYGIPLLLEGVSGTVSAATHQKDPKFWTNWAQSQVGSAVGIAEVMAGAVITAAGKILGGGKAGTDILGGTLMGAGFSGMMYSTFYTVNSKGDFDWGEFGKAEATGAIGGAVAGIAGGLLGLAADAANAAQWSAKALLGLKIGLGALQGATSSAAAAGSHAGMTGRWDVKMFLIDTGIGALVGAGAAKIPDIPSIKNAPNDMRDPADIPINIRQTNWQKFLGNTRASLKKENAFNLLMHNLKPGLMNLKKYGTTPLNHYLSK